MGIFKLALLAPVVLLTATSCAAPDEFGLTKTDDGIEIWVLDCGVSTIDSVTVHEARVVDREAKSGDQVWRIQRSPDSRGAGRITLGTVPAGYRQETPFRPSQVANYVIDVWFAEGGKQQRVAEIDHLKSDRLVYDGGYHDKAQSNC